MRRIYLVGPRGCGKTTIAAKLGEALGMPVRDTDAIIQERIEQSIAEMVAGQGWQAFRDLESRVLEKLSRLDGIIATGGGIVLNSHNRRRMRRCGTVIYLSAPSWVLAQRLERQPEPDLRPALTGLDPRKEIEAVLAERHPMYLESAHHVVDATACPDTVVAAITSLVRP